MKRENKNAGSSDRVLVQASAGNFATGYFQAEPGRNSAVKAAVKTIWTITCIPSAVRMMSCCTCCPCC